MPEINVRRAATEDIQPLAHVLARAFADDPYVEFLTLPDERREARQRCGWAGLLRFSSNGLSHTYTTDQLAGAAIWIPPGSRGASRMDSLRLLGARIYMSGWKRLPRVL